MCVCVCVCKYRGCLIMCFWFVLFECICDSDRGSDSLDVVFMFLCVIRM
jgi:hypothetical protein